MDTPSFLYRKDPQIQLVLYPQRIDKDIAEEDPVRLLTDIIESLYLGLCLLRHCL